MRDKKMKSLTMNEEADKRFKELNFLGLGV